MTPLQNNRVLSRALLLLALVCPLRLALAADHKAPPAKQAEQYAAFDKHEQEHVTIAAEPCDEPKQCSFFRLEYIQHGFIPVRVVITNDRDDALVLDEARMQFISANDDKIPAATLEELNRRLFLLKNAKGKKLPIPIPIPITVHPPPVDKKIAEDDKDFAFASTTVPPHSTLAGYLFYDVRGLDDSPLKGAELYVKMIRTQESKQELFAFTIPFDKWLATQK